MQARQQRADREIAEILRRRSGLMADEVASPLPARPERLYRPAE
jgi:hypothetical protein